MTVLANPSGDMHQVAFLDVADLGSDCPKANDTVPMGVGLPRLAIFAIVVRRHAHIRNLLQRPDSSNPANDPKLGNILRHKEQPFRFEECFGHVVN
jgi:hypothetical protein